MGTQSTEKDDILGINFREEEKKKGGTERLDLLKSVEKGSCVSPTVNVKVYRGPSEFLGVVPESSPHQPRLILQLSITNSSSEQRGDICRPGPLSGKGGRLELQLSEQLVASSGLAGAKLIYDFSSELLG
ncbi:hypothetical protein Q8A73_001990 [Channa argus]|nr:hypothetical protein Q8A73_001990 [Channa argus]